jgi:hypothetical protein
MRSMRFFHPMVRPRELSRIYLGTLCAHRACLAYGLRCSDESELLLRTMYPKALC